MAQNNAPQAAPQAAQQNTNPRSGFSLGNIPGIQLPGQQPAPQRAPAKAQQQVSTNAQPQPRPMQPQAPRMLVPKPTTEIPGDRGDVDGGATANDIMARLAKQPPAKEEVVDPTPELPDNEQTPTNIEIPEPETAAATEPAEVPEYDSEEKPPAGNKAQARWTELKKMEKEYRTLQKEMKELKKAPQNTEEVAKIKAELEAIRKQHEEAVTELRAIDVTKDPEFKSKIQEPLHNTINEALQSVPEGARSDLISALTSNTRGEIMAKIHAMQEKHGLEAWQMDTIRAYAQEIIPMARRYQEVIQNKRLYAERLQQEREQKAQDAHRQRAIILDQQYADAAAEESLKTYLDGEAKQSVKEFMDSLDEPVNAARAAVWSHVGPRLQQQVRSLQSELKKLKAEQEKTTKLSNDVAPSGGGFASKDEPENYNFDSRSIQARLRARFQ